MSFTRVRYINERRAYNMYDKDSGKFVASQNVDTVPKNDTLIKPEVDGSYIGVYDSVTKKFIVDYDYDPVTGWFWPNNELPWSSYEDNEKGVGGGR